MYHQAPLFKAMPQWHAQLSAQDVILLCEDLDSTIEENVGTLCSGSSIETKALRRLEITWADVFGKHVKHIYNFGAGNSPAKQAFLKQPPTKQQNMKMLFGDAAHCSQMFAHDVLSGRARSVPVVHSLSAGFARTGKSNLNKNRSNLKDCVQQARGETGLTFQYVGDVVAALHPEQVTLENVKQIDSKDAGAEMSYKEWITKWFNEHGYDAAWFGVQAGDYGSFADRYRLFLHAFRGEKGSSATRFVLKKKVTKMPTLKIRIPSQSKASTFLYKLPHCQLRVEVACFACIAHTIYYYYFDPSNSLRSASLPCCISS